MDSVVRSDFAITADIIDALPLMLNGKWEDAATSGSRAKIAKMAFVISGYCCRLQGEEIVKAKHATVLLIGSIKGEY